MKKIILTVIFLLFSATAFSQVQLFGTYCDEKVKPDVNIFVSKPITEKIKFTAFGLIEEKWAEGLIGLAYSPTDYMEIGIGAGLEQNPALYRLTASVWVGKGRTSLFVVGEKGDGGDNYWYKATGKYQISKNFSAGIQAWRFTGVGPYIEAEIKPLDSKIWVNPTYDFESEKTKLTLGVDIKF